MDELVASIARWLVPILVGLVIAAAIVALAVLVIRRHRRGPAARARAETQRAAAGVALVRLDDALGEFDLEVTLSGALYDATAPGSVRRARMGAEHARDASIDLLLSLTPDSYPAEILRAADGVHARTAAASRALSGARSDHGAWVTAHVGAATQIQAARARSRRVGAELGDPGALLALLAERYDRSEWGDAAQAAEEASTALARADDLLAQAAARADDPARSALPVLADAERALRAAQDAARRFEERGQLVDEAGTAVAGEVAGARTALQQARDLPLGADGERVAAALTELDAELGQIEAAAGRRPTQAVESLVRLHERLELAVGESRTAQQRTRSARAILPATIAVARRVIAAAEPRVRAAGADARLALAMAHRELAAARSAADPIAAVTAARRAARHAEGAAALVGYDAVT